MVTIAIFTQANGFDNDVLTIGRLVDGSPITNAVDYIVLYEIGNYINYKVWDEITHPIANNTGQPLKFENG